MNTPELTAIAHQDTADGIAQQVVGAVIHHGGRILLLKRPIDDFRGGTCELPSGKVEPTDADPITALHREVTEETGLAIAEITAHLGSFDYTSGSGKHTRQRTWTVTVTNSGEARVSEHDEATWVSDSDQRPVSPKSNGSWAPTSPPPQAEPSH